MTATGAAACGQVTLRQVQARARIRAVAGLPGPASVAYAGPGNFASAGHLPAASWPEPGKSR